MGLAELAAEADLAHGDHVGGDGRSHSEDATASATARSAPGSVTRTPPTAEAYTSRRLTSKRSRSASTATASRADRLDAWASRAAGRRSRLGGQGLHLDEQRPVTVERRHDHRARHAAAAIGEEQPARVGAPAASPVAVISNTPSSLGRARSGASTARSRRRAWWRSPSKDSTVSTTCSSTRGPASAPSLVTWPTSIDATPSVLADRTSGGRTRAPGRPSPAADPSAGSERSGSSRPRPVAGCTYSRWASSVGSDVSVDSHSSGGTAPSRSARALHLRRRLLGRDVQHRRPRRASLGRDLEQQRGLADARLAAEQGDRAGDQPAAEHPVELEHARGDGMAVGEVDLRDRQRGRRRPQQGHHGRRVRGSSTRVFHSLQLGQRPTQVGLDAPRIAAMEGGSNSGHAPTLRTRCDTDE